MINCCNKKIASAISQKKKRIERQRWKNAWMAGILSISLDISANISALVPFLFHSASHSYARTLTRSSAQFQQWHLFKSAGSSLFQYWVHINDDGCAHAIPHNGSSIIFLFCPCNEAGRLNAFLWSRRNAYMNAIRYSALVWSVYLFIYFIFFRLWYTRFGTVCMRTCNHCFSIDENVYTS